MEYRILGPLEVVRDGVPVDLGGRKQRAVLATLLLDRGRVVPTERIVDQVWGDDVPAAVAAGLQANVSHLRRALREDTGASPIARQPPGYRLDVPDDRVDVHHFLTDADASRGAVEAGDWTGAVRAAEVALAWWRGELLADLRDEDWVQVAAVALDERRRRCAEDLVTGLLGAGRATDALDAARRLRAADPLRERSNWLHLVALHRDGRTTQALDEYRALVRRLDDELGLDPGPDLRDLQSAILRHDPAIAVWPRVRQPAAHGSEPVTPGVAPTAPEAPPDGQGALPDGPGTLPDGPGAEPFVEPGGLVGRAPELAAIAEAVDEALGGGAEGGSVSSPGGVRWLVLTGPAGIGKTRLAEEAMAHAARRGARVVRAQCPDDEGVPPWWPVSQLVRALDADPGEILAADPDAEADRARFAVYERVRVLLDSAARRGPLAVVVDDVQWADPSSLGLLSYLTFALEGVPVAVTLTARAGVTGSDLRRLLDAVARRPGTRGLAVPPLSGVEVGELVRRVSGEETTRAETALLLTRTGGNPFFVSEYARLPRVERETGQIPLVVRSVLDRRLDALDAGTLQVLRTAAVIGETLDIALLRRVTRLDVDELTDLLDEAADERIVVVSPGSHAYTFAHGLLRDQLLAGMSDARRRRLNARVAEAIGPGRDTETLVRRAGHLLAALPLVEPEEVFDACRDAALDADARWQTDAAAYWWDAALGTFDALPASRRDPADRDELVTLRLTALLRAGRGQTVYELVDREVDAAVRAGRPAAAGALCSILIRSAGAWPWVAVEGDPGPLLSTLERAETVLAGDPAAHARLLAALAVGNCYHPDGDVPDRLSRRAVELAEPLGDADVLADALLGRCLLFAGVAARAGECRALVARIGGLGHRLAGVDEVICHGQSVMLRALAGDLDAAAEHCRLGGLGSDALRLPICRVQFRLAESMLALWQGRFDDAEALNRDGMRLRDQIELYPGWDRMTLVVSRWRRGLLSTLPPEPVPDDLERICAAVDAGDRETADRLVAERLDDDGPLAWTSHGTWALLAHAVADLRLVRHAGRLVALLEPLAGQVAIVGMMSVVGPVSLALARLRLLTGDVDTARREATAARDLARRAGGRPSELHARLLLSEIDGAAPDELTALAADAEAAGVHGVALAARRVPALPAG